MRQYIPVLVESAFSIERQVMVKKASAGIQLAITPSNSIAGVFVWPDGSYQVQD